MAVRRLLVSVSLLVVAGCVAPGVAPEEPSPGVPPSPTAEVASVEPSPSTVTDRQAPTAEVPSPARSPRPSFSSSVRDVSATELADSWRVGCPVPVEELRTVDVAHWGFDAEVHMGRLVVAADVADSVVAVMAELFVAGFPIERMEPVEVYGGDDDASMAANNTSAFNCRAVTGGAGWSEHSYGRAIDVNPLINPYVSGSLVLPPAGAAYLDRSADVPGMIRADGVVVAAFAAHGWLWGGAWSDAVDYQHFSTTGR